MILDSKTARGMLFNADTGQPIRWARWADLATGEYEAFRINPELAKERGLSLASLLYRGRCSLKFVPATVLEAKSVGRVALSMPLAEIKKEVLGGRTVRRIVPIPGLAVPECDEPLCHRPADWAVADELLVEPERGADGKLYERAVTVGTRQYCAWHYRPPTETSLRGVTRELEEIGIRPQ